MTTSAPTVRNSYMATLVTMGLTHTTRTRTVGAKKGNGAKYRARNSNRGSRERGTY